MLPSDWTKFALTFVLLLLVGSLGAGQATDDEPDGKQDAADQPTSRDESQSSSSPSIDAQFKRLLDEVLDDKELTQIIAEYMEIVPASHRSRSLVVSSLPVAQENKTEHKDIHKDMPANDPTLLRDATKPMKMIVEYVLGLGTCAANCSELVCMALLDAGKERLPQQRKSHDRSLHLRPQCSPCPVPQHCPLPGVCDKCPPKPACPCGDEPEAKLVPEAPSLSRSSEDSAKRGQLRRLGNFEILTSIYKQGPNSGQYRSEQRRSWRPGSSSTTTTTTRRPSSTTTQASKSTTRKSVISPKRSRPPWPTIKSPSTTTTTTSRKPSVMSTKKSAAATSPRPSSTSTTTERAEFDDEESSPFPQTSTSTTTTTSVKPKVGASTSVRAKPQVSITRGQPKRVNETIITSQESKRVIDVDGKKQEILGRNATITSLEYLILEDGLKTLIRNRTVVEFITDAINAAPLRSGGREGQLADRILHGFGENTDRWTLHPSRGSRNHRANRAMTYSTLWRNQVHILRHIVARVIKKRCKHCVDECTDKALGLPQDELACRGQEKVAQNHSSESPGSAGGEKQCSPCWMSAGDCPAPPGCLEYSCISPIYCQDWREPATKATTRLPAKPSTSASDLSRSAKPTQAATDEPATSQSTTTTTTTTLSPSSGQSHSKTAATKRPKPKDARDPDFPSDDPMAPRSGDINRPLKYYEDSVVTYDDMDLTNQIPEDERFAEIPCKGPICEDQKSCGAADLNELTPKDKQSGYIVNGKRQKYGEWPSYAKLTIRVREYESSLCGGVLIGRRHVLTAGHCVRRPQTESDDVEKEQSNGNKTGEAAVEAEMDKLRPEDVEVSLGEDHRDKKDEFETHHNVSKICFSTKFYSPKGEGSRFDFAVITLKNEAKFDDHIQPACLPYKPFPIGKSKCFVVGQGKKNQKNKNYLVGATHVRKMPIARAWCRDWGFNEHDRSRWCFTKRNGQGDSCAGDSGGPILCRSKENKWHVMGLVSYGSELCDGTQDMGWVAVYSRIPGMLEQIHSDCLNEPLEIDKEKE